MYRCLDCGKAFENPREYSECIGSFWGDPAYQTFEECPYCCGDIEELVQCEICGGYVSEEDLTNGVCECCAREEIDFSSAFRYLTKTNRLRDFFLVWLWGIVKSVDAEKECKEIDRTLMAVFRHEEAENPEIFKKKLQEYILEDIYDWTEFLEKEVKANENSKD